MNLVRDEQLVLYHTDPLSDRGSIWVNVSRNFGLPRTLKSLSMVILTSCCLLKLS